MLDPKPRVAQKLGGAFFARGTSRPEFSMEKRQGPQLVTSSLGPKNGKEWVAETTINVPPRRSGTVNRKLDMWGKKQ